MPGRNVIPSDPYRYGHNGQEREKETFEGAYSAEFWGYDSRLVRRWEQDPVVKPWESPYACFKGNPIYYADPSGLDGDGNKEKGKGNKGGDHTYYEGDKIKDNFKRGDQITYLEGDKVKKGETSSNNHYDPIKMEFQRQQFSTPDWIFDSKIVEGLEKNSLQSLKRLNPNSSGYMFKKAMYSKTFDYLSTVSKNLDLFDAVLTFKDIANGEVTLGLPLEFVAKKQIAEMEYMLLEVAFKIGEYKPFVTNLRGFNRVVKDGALGGILVTESELKERIKNNTFDTHGMNGRIQTQDFVSDPGKNEKGEEYKYFILFPATDSKNATITNFSVLKIK